jgi:predicted  nucleic acid-binding Zn-ribbon protein
MRWPCRRHTTTGTEQELRQLRLQLEHLEKTMVTRVAFDTAMGVLKTNVARIVTDIQALRDKIANGVEITDQDLADVQTLASDIDVADPVPVP